ncbi:GNAT family N-acetyltransferase [Halorientalis sp. IM1011]|uniref:GNAT family N-acetyltransferase n=1 Tax=Halorientalis sp. IM1011 TaxID=1932360 RepID=UPI00097CCC66|nr:GNAT family N-acetyltransferase [Halorientalis sp. IM1011]AQL41821.1 GNAT family N-acetyltransferase [Halorientalis sp. IM1011]
MPDARIEVVAGDGDLSDAFAVRRDVFVDEQGVDEAVEIDGRDDDAVHTVAYEGSRPVGTARLRTVGDDTGKVERVAVRRERRGEELGRKLMDTVEDLARERDLDRLVLHAQTTVEEFYRKLGYETVSDEFEEAGIPHVEMTKQVR